MTGASGLEASLRDLIREVVREEIRTALDGQSRRNATSNPDDDGGGYMSLTRAAQLADVAPGTLRRWIREGRLDASRAGRVFRIRRDELERFLANPVRDVVKEARALLGRAA
jgi:excisionase family DNA binding protein